MWQGIPSPKQYWARRHGPRSYVCQAPNAFVCVSGVGPPQTPNAFICVSPNAFSEFATELASLVYLCSLWTPNGTPKWEPQNGNPKMGTPKWEPQNGTPKWEPQNGNPKMGTPKWEPQNGNPKMGTPKWEPQNGNPKMGTPKWEPQNGNPKMGTPPKLDQIGTPPKSEPHPNRNTTQIGTPPKSEHHPNRNTTQIGTPPKSEHHPNRNPAQIGTPPKSEPRPNRNPTQIGTPPKSEPHPNRNPTQIGTPKSGPTPKSEPPNRTSQKSDHPKWDPNSDPKRTPDAGVEQGRCQTHSLRRVGTCCRGKQTPQRGCGEVQATRISLNSTGHESLGHSVGTSIIRRGPLTGTFLERIPEVRGFAVSVVIAGSQGLARANYLLRVVEPQSVVWRCLCRILRIDVVQEEHIRSAAGMHLVLGGLGLRSAVRFRSAFWASWADVCRWSHPDIAMWTPRRWGLLLLPCGRTGTMGLDLLRGERWRIENVEPEDLEPGSVRRGWQHEAASRVDRHFREHVLFDRLLPRDRAQVPGGARRQFSPRRITRRFPLTSFV